MFNQLASLQLMYNAQNDVYAIRIYVQTLNIFIPVFVFQEYQDIDFVVEEITRQICDMRTQYLQPPKTLDIPKCWIDGWKDEKRDNFS